MSDTLTPQQRHANMAAIHGKDTKPEMIVRRYLWSHGFRYRLNHQRLPGRPDIVLRRYRTCIFINGCFWHGHHINFPTAESSECCKIPKSNSEFWLAKIRRNKERDAAVQQMLSDMGWHSITIWECQLKPKYREQTLESLSYTLNSIFLKNHTVHRYSVEEDHLMLAAEDVGA